MKLDFEDIIIFTAIIALVVGGALFVAGVWSGVWQ